MIGGKKYSCRYISKWKGVRGRWNVQIGTIAPHGGGSGDFESTGSCIRQSSAWGGTQWKGKVCGVMNHDVL